MTHGDPPALVCPNCHSNVSLNTSAVPGQVSAAMRLRKDTLGTQVQCPHCHQPFIHKAHPTPAPIGISIQDRGI